MAREWIFDDAGLDLLVLRRPLDEPPTPYETRLSPGEAALRLDAANRAGRGTLRPRLRDLLDHEFGVRGFGGGWSDERLMELVGLALREGRIRAFIRPRPRLSPPLRDKGKTPPLDPVDDAPPKKTFVEFTLLDEEGVPVADEKYSIELPDGSTRDGALDGDGHMRIDDIDDGTCWVTFPEIKVRKRPGDAGG